MMFVDCKRKQRLTLVSKVLGTQSFEEVFYIIGAIFDLLQHDLIICNYDRMKLFK